MEGYLALIKEQGEEYNELKEKYERLLELCMYALIRDTKIYNHELDNQHKQLFINTIKENLNCDTYKIRKKLIDIWEGGFK